MRNRRRHGETSLIAAFGLLLLLSTFAPAGAEAPASEELVVFLVRHAEKVDDSDDPELSPVGAERVEELARVLRNAEISHVHSSDFVRTRETALPIARAIGVEVEIYDPRDPASLADRLRQTGGRHLVVGHSNTTPGLVEQLGGKPGEKIDDASEYDRLYIVTVGTDGVASTVLLRYGTHADGQEER